MKFIRMWQYGVAGVLAAFLAACSSTPSREVSVSGIDLPAGQAMPLGYVYAPGVGGAAYRVVSYSALPQWHQQNFTASLQAFRSGCLKLQNLPAWRNVCAQAQRTPLQQAAAQRFFERYFTPWEVSQNGRLAGTVTGYYEPVLSGDTKPTSRARFPIYGLPSDFVSVPLSGSRSGQVRIRLTGANSGVIDGNGSYVADLSQFPLNAKSTYLRGRVEGGRFVPYYTRAQINAGALNGKAPVLGYADDPVELFFLHIQGSGRLKTPDGRFVRLGFAAKNDYPYVSIGKYMAQKGYLPLAQTSMQGIKAWLQKNPQKLAEVLGQNPSYVFFQTLPDNNAGPVGALGVPLMGGYTGAVDKHFISLGAPLFVATTHPVSGFGLNRLIMAQDTGTAINGAVRVDYFWGYGDEAGAVAGKMKHTGYVWQLLPNGMLPEVK